MRTDRSVRSFRIARRPRWHSAFSGERKGPPTFLGCPPFLGPPQMGDYAENSHANRLTDFCTLIDPFLVTGRAELFRRRVLQRAMRPDGVVFPPVPCRLFPSVRHALEFHPLQELVTQSTVKRFYISILPGASRGYRDRLRPHTRQPVHQRLANELRSIVTPDAGRRPATTNHPGHDPPNIGPVIELSACHTRHSRVYSSTKVNHLSGRPPAVRSWMKSQVQTSFLNRAGWCTQLFALVPGFGPSFLVFLSLKGLRSPRLFQSRRTRLRFTDQPLRTSRAWIRLYP